MHISLRLKIDSDQTCKLPTLYITCISPAVLFFFFFLNIFQQSSSIEHDGSHTPAWNKRKDSSAAETREALRSAHRHAHANYNIKDHAPPRRRLNVKLSICRESARSSWDHVSSNDLRKCKEATDLHEILENRIHWLRDYWICMERERGLNTSMANTQCKDPRTPNKGWIQCVMIRKASAGSEYCICWSEERLHIIKEGIKLKLRDIIKGHSLKVAPYTKYIYIWLVSSSLIFIATLLFSLLPR